jgi:hypothetical protein
MKNESKLLEIANPDNTHYFTPKPKAEASGEVAS